MRTLLLSAALVLVTLASSAIAQTQITTGVIQGVVTDATGAVMPGVTVEARNLETNLSRTVVTGTDGRFVLLQLPSGTYTVTYTLSGFATLVQENIGVTVGQAVTLAATMRVSALAETVRVDAAAPVVETTRSAVADTLNQTTIESTPILGRKFEDLLTLTPGVSVVQGADGDEITFAGQRGVFNNISMDGGDFNNGFFGEQVGGQRVAIDITLDAVKEFQVIASGAPAEFGRTAGGVVNVITKSGTNSRLGQNEGLPIEHPVKTAATLLKLDLAAGNRNNISTSWNFNHSRKENETFDVATYGTSANGIEGNPAHINVANLNWFTTLSSRTLNEAHFTYSRETRPRTAAPSKLAADTGMGFSPTFRFGNPFFLQPGVDELIWRTQIKDNLSLVRGAHTFKVGGEWMHTLNDQVFRGFFTGRYLFDSVTGFLRYATPAAPGGFGPSTVGCSNGSYVTAPTPCPAGTTATGGPLLFY